jgi:hypothetical protein
VTDEDRLEDARRSELEDEEDIPEDDLLEDDIRPDGRSDPKDPWHGLNDFDDPKPNP